MVMPESMAPNHSTQNIHNRCAARSCARHSPPRPARRATSPINTSVAAIGWAPAMWRHMSSGYMAPSDSTVTIAATFNGPKLLARAIENATTIAVPDSAITAASAARAGTINHATTIAASSTPYCRLAGTSNRLRTCHKKNRRTMVSPRLGSSACRANSVAWAANRPTPTATAAASHWRRCWRGPNQAQRNGTPTSVNASSWVRRHRALASARVARVARVPGVPGVPGVARVPGVPGCQRGVVLSASNTLRYSARNGA